MKLPKEVQFIYEHGDESVREAIAEGWMRRVEALSESWDFELEEFFSEPIKVRVSDGFGAKLTDEGMIISDPDVYRASMIEEFSSDDERVVREMVNEEYPEPFHELDEETGQLIGRRMSKNWDFKGDFVDGFKDELYGILAIKKLHPEFLPYYGNRIERNLEAVVELNSKDQIEIAEDLYKSNQDFEDLYNMDNLESLKQDYSRGEERTPDSFLEASQRIANNYDLEEEMTKEALKSWRNDKLISESRHWRSQLAAYRIAYGDGLFKLENPNLLLDGEAEELVEKAAMHLDEKIRREYSIPL